VLGDSGGVWEKDGNTFTRYIAFCNSAYTQVFNGRSFDFDDQTVTSASLGVLFTKSWNVEHNVALNISVYLYELPGSTYTLLGTINDEIPAGTYSFDINTSAVNLSRVFAYLIVYNKSVSLTASQIPPQPSTFSSVYEALAVGFTGVYYQWYDIKSIIRVNTQYSSTTPQQTYCSLDCVQTSTRELNFTDGIDDDCDLLIDCRDPDSCGDIGCAALGDPFHDQLCQVENCSNGIDDNGDGLFDCEDTSFCCANDACSNAIACGNFEANICDFGGYNSLCVISQDKTETSITDISLNDLEVRSTLTISNLSISARGDVQILSGASINGDELGFDAAGPGKSSGSAGAGYGGDGGGQNNKFYGSALAPSDPGSGNSLFTNAGGGYLKINATTLINNGVITLVGEDGRGAGSGGGLYIISDNVYGTGTYTVIGGDGKLMVVVVVAAALQ